MKQKDIIIAYLREVGDWVPGYNIPSRRTELGFIGSDGIRVCRALSTEENGHIPEIHKKRVGKFIYYKYIIEGQKLLV